MNTKEEKNALRKQMLAKRNAMNKDEKSLVDKNICSGLQKIVADQNIKIVHTYLPMKSEINVIPFIIWAMGEGITIVVSKTLPERKLENLILTDLEKMEKGVFGTYHPKDAEVYNREYDLIIVAGLAFSADLYRVGYGGGYYDSFLKDHIGAYKIGVAYPFQMINTVPVETHDVQLDHVISDQIEI